MGIEEKERKIRNRNDKKFVFDWNADDDTSRDLNPIYTHKHRAQLFGRGHFAGIDVKDRKDRDQFYDKLLANRRSDAEVARAGYVLYLTAGPLLSNATGRRSSYDFYALIYFLFLNCA